MDKWIRAFSILLALISLILFITFVIIANKEGATEDEKQNAKRISVYFVTLFLLMIVFVLNTLEFFQNTFVSVLNLILSSVFFTLLGAFSASANSKDTEEEIKFQNGWLAAIFGTLGLGFFLLVLYYIASLDIANRITYEY